MRKPLQARPLETKEAAVPVGANEALHASPRMVAQRQRFAASFGPAAQLQTEAEPNRTGLPDGLKAGIESLSGMDMSGVRVHRNSAQPAQLDAHAYAQGNDIHLAPGQEQHLPHEAWHVVQQRQGRVPATLQMARTPVNDDQALEQEADVMGARAAHEITAAAQSPVSAVASQAPSTTSAVAQGKFYGDGEWMQDVPGTTLREKFGEVTGSLWEALQADGVIVFVSAGGSGGSFDFSRNCLQIAKDWLQPIEAYVKKGTKEAHLARGITGLTHEMSHAHDHLIRKESPHGADQSTNDWVRRVLQTELRAWFAEAKSGRQNSREKDLNQGEDDLNLLYSWVAVHFRLQQQGDVLAMTQSGNVVVGRIVKYYKDNRPESAKGTDAMEALRLLLSDGLDAQLAEYARAVRDLFTSSDDKMMEVTRNYN